MADLSEQLILRHRLARVLGISIGTPKRWERIGRLLPSHQVGHRLRAWKLEEVRHLLAGVADDAE